MEKKDVKTGDTLLVNADTFLSKIIRKVMKKWGKRQGYPINIIYSHAARFIWIADTLYVFGSIENGYQPWEFDKHYDWEKSDFAVMRRKKELSVKEVKQTTNYVLHLDTVSISYQYWNFIQWLLLVYLNISTFNNDRDKFTYCYESEHKARKNLNPNWYVGSVAQTDIFELLYDSNYEIIYRNKE